MVFPSVHTVLVAPFVWAFWPALAALKRDALLAQRVSDDQRWDAHRTVAGVAIRPTLRPTGLRISANHAKTGP